MSNSVMKSYEKWVAEFGRGIFSSTFRIYEEEHNKELSKQFRDSLKEYWFWEASLQEQVCDPSSILLGDTLMGDYVFCVDNRVVVLPRQAEEAAFFDNFSSFVEEVLDGIQLQKEEWPAPIFHSSARLHEGKSIELLAALEQLSWKSVVVEEYGKRFIGEVDDVRVFFDDETIDVYSTAKQSIVASQYGEVVAKWEISNEYLFLGDEDTF